MKAKSNHPIEIRYENVLRGDVGTIAVCSFDISVEHQTWEEFLIHKIVLDSNLCKIRESFCLERYLQLLLELREVFTYGSAVIWVVPWSDELG